MKMKKIFSKTLNLYRHDEGSINPFQFGTPYTGVTAREILIEARRRGYDMSGVDCCKTSGRGRDWRALYWKPWFVGLKAEMTGLKPGVPVKVVAVAEALDTPARREAFEQAACRSTFNAGELPCTVEVPVKYTGEIMKVQFEIEG